MHPKQKHGITYTPHAGRKKKRKKTHLIGELEREQLEGVGVLLPQHHGLGGLVPAAVQLLVEHHLADDGVCPALLHVEHLAQRRQAERLVERRVREEVRPQGLRLDVIGLNIFMIRGVLSFCLPIVIYPRSNLGSLPPTVRVVYFYTKKNTARAGQARLLSGQYNPYKHMIYTGGGAGGGGVFAPDPWIPARRGGSHYVRTPSLRVH